MTAADIMATVDQIRQLIQSGLTVPDAVRTVGRMSRPAFYRWMKVIAGGGLEEVQRRISGDMNRGRPASLSLTEAECAALRMIRLRKRSLENAVMEILEVPSVREHFRPEIIQALVDAKSRNPRRRTAYPTWLKAAAHVGPEMKAEFRGPKAAGDMASVMRRGMFWRDEDGQEHLIQPGDVWESDDMSTNTPHRSMCPVTGREQLGRQCLFTMDVAALRWLGVDMLVRPRDAYRAEDIADHMANMVAAYGLPRFWRLERGRWENNFIDGVKLSGLGADYDGRRWGGLDAIIHIQRAWESRGKGSIEGSFSLLQDLVDHPDCGTPTIGRVRGEFEGATKDFLRANREPRQGENDLSGVQETSRQKSLAKFWSINEAGDAMAVAMERFNARPKKRQAYGSDMVVPDELWAERPAKRECPESELWRFLPIKRQATILQGQILCTDKYWGQFCFQVNGVSADLFLPHGYKVLIAFHPGRPEQGCHVFNADMSPANRWRWKFGQKLLVARVLQLAPQIDLSGGKPEAKTRAAAASRKEFRAARDARVPGAAPLRESRVADGLGRIVALGNVPAPELETLDAVPAEVAGRGGKEQTAPSRLGEPANAAADEAQPPARGNATPPPGLSRAERIAAAMAGLTH